MFLINQLFLASWGRVWKFRVRRNSTTNGRVWHCSGSHQLMRCWGQNWCGWKHDHKVHLWLWILNLLSCLAEEAALKACCSWYITYRFFLFQCYLVMMIVDLQFTGVWMLVLSCISNNDTIASFFCFIAGVSGTVFLLPIEPQLLQWDFRRIAAFI